MDKIAFYKYCEQALVKLIHNHRLDMDDCKAISREYAGAIYVEMQNIGAGFDAANFAVLSVHLQAAKEIYDSRYYEKLVDKLEKQKHEEELRERELKINESAASASLRSAKAAELSALYAKESNLIAKKSNRTANIALFISIATAAATIVSTIYMVNKRDDNTILNDNKTDTPNVVDTVSTQGNETTKTYKLNINNSKK